MALEQLAFIADILGSVGVIVSLIFVAYELNKSTAQSKLANYGDMVDRFMFAYSQSSDLELAKLIAKGRKSYMNLTEDEKISFEQLRGFPPPFLQAIHDALDQDEDS